MKPGNELNQSSLVQEMLNIFKQRAVYLTGKTWVLFWPLIIAVILGSLSSLSKAWSPWGILQPLLLITFILIFVIFSLPKLRLFQIEILFWIKRYLRQKEIVPVEESHEFIKQHLKRITSYKRFVIVRYYLILAILWLIPFTGFILIFSLDHVITGSAHLILGYIAIVSILLVPLLGIFTAIYWLVLRDMLRYSSVSLVEGLDSTNDLSNTQILQNARAMAKKTKLKDTVKFIAEDLVSGTLSSLPATATGTVSRLAPKPVAAAANAYAEAYSVNTYLLMNAIEVYAMYIAVETRTQTVLLSSKN